MNVNPAVKAFLLLLIITKGLFVHGSGRGEEAMPLNRLQFEQSPYLLQHADNPVDWYPWSEEAFRLAGEQDKPIFLSIGYSTCHWCHVMEHESFEDQAVAQLMNEAFVSIKVDREERPDLDEVYMTVAQLLTGGGGWPLNIIMTPDKRPFYAATYIPKESRQGRLGMLDLIPRVEDIWRNRRQELIRSATEITAALKQVAEAPQPGPELGPEILRTAYQSLRETFDEQRGGFGSAPKFPTPHHHYFLLRYWKRTGEARALKMVERTLKAMRHGGIYDQLGFGFHRYSTDSAWLVPHFEKMLYDQALIALAYIEAYQATGKQEYARTVREIFTYVLRDMRSPEGGFYSAEDADSQGEEGKFYLWTREELKSLLEGEEFSLFSRLYNIEGPGNYLEEASRRRTGQNIPHLSLEQGDGEASPSSPPGQPLQVPPEQQDRLEQIRQKLFAHREGRVHPLKDDKILTSWNGLMIAALAKAAGALAEPRYAEAAEQAASFILDHLRGQDGRLLHRYRKGTAGIAPYAEDYAYLTWGLIELYEATHRLRYLKLALELTDQSIEHYWNEEDGGFFTTANDAEPLIARQQDFYDGALPSENSVALLNLIRLARITENRDYSRKAEQLIRLFASKVNQLPQGFTFFLSALDFHLGPSWEVVIAGSPAGEDTRAMLQAVRRLFLPNKILLLRPSDEGEPEISRLAPFTRYHSTLQGQATAYVCQDYTCQLPTVEIETMLRLLNGK